MIKPGITAIAAGAILAVVVSACGGGGTSAPQTASQILTSNGYIPVPASQSSEVAMILGGGPPASDFSSVAVGVSARDGLGKDSSGTSTYQEVMVLDTRRRQRRQPDVRRVAESGQGSRCHPDAAWRRPDGDRNRQRYLGTIARLSDGDAPQEGQQRRTWPSASDWRLTPWSGTGGEISLFDGQ